MIDYLFTDEIKREVVKVLSLNEEERQKYIEKKLRKLAKDIDFPIDWNDLVENENVLRVSELRGIGGINETVRR